MAVKVKSLTISRDGNAWTAKWSVPSELSKKGNATHLHVEVWLMSGTGKKRREILVGKRNETVQKSSSKFTLERGKTYPLSTGKKARSITQAAVWVYGYNGKKKFPEEVAYYKLRRPLQPSLAAGTFDSGKVTWKVTAKDSSKTTRDRYQVKWNVYRSGRYGGTAIKEASVASGTLGKNNAAISNDSTVTYTEKLWGNLTSDSDYIKLRAVLNAQGLRGDGVLSSSTTRPKKRERAFYISYPPVPAIGKPAISASDEVRVPVTTNATTEHPVDKVRLQYACTVARPAESDWKDVTGSEGRSTCKGLSARISSLAAQEGQRVWFRLVNRYLVESHDRASDPIEAVELRDVGKLTTGVPQIINATGGSDGKSVSLQVCWDDDLLDCDTTTLGWSKDADAWKSNEQPTTFDMADVDWEDEGAGYAETTDTEPSDTKTYYSKTADNRYDAESGANLLYDGAPTVLEHTSSQNIDGPFWFWSIGSGTENASKVAAAHSAGGYVYLQDMFSWSGTRPTKYLKVPTSKIVEYAGTDNTSLCTMHPRPGEVAVAKTGANFGWRVAPFACDSVAAIWYTETWYERLYAHSLTLKVANLDESETYWFRARRSSSTRKTKWGDPVACNTSGTPVGVVLTAPEAVADGDPIDVTWTLNGKGEQKTWHLYVDGTEQMNGGTEQSASVPASLLAGKSSVTLKVSAGYGGDLAESAEATVSIIPKPEASPKLGANAITARPIPFTVSSNSAGATVFLALVAVGCVWTTADGKRHEQLEGDVVWSGSVYAEEAGTEYAGEIAECELVDGAEYRFRATPSVGSVTGDTSWFEYEETYTDDDGAEATRTTDAVPVEWAHQAVAPTGTVTPDPSDMSAAVAITAPDGAVDTDVCDVYRVTPDGAEAIATGVAFGKTVTDRWAPYSADGTGTAYRLVTRTADGDYDWVDVAYSLTDKRMRVDWDTGSVWLPWNLSVSESWEKGFEGRVYLDGTKEGWWTAGSERKASLSVDLAKAADGDVQASVRALARWDGACFVRLPDGCAYEADVQVSGLDYDQTTPNVSVSISTEQVKCDDFVCGEEDIA